MEEGCRKKRRIPSGSYAHGRKWIQEAGSDKGGSAKGKGEVLPGGNVGEE